MKIELKRLQKKSQAYEVKRDLDQHFISAFTTKLQLICCFNMYLISKHATSPKGLTYHFVLGHKIQLFIVSR